MFIHCYLELISKRATSEAHQLLTKQKQRFISTGATTSKIRQQVCLLILTHATVFKKHNDPSGCTTAVS